MTVVRRWLRPTPTPATVGDFLLDWLRRFCVISAVAVAVAWPPINALYVAEYHHERPRISVGCVEPVGGPELPCPLAPSGRP